MESLISTETPGLSCHQDAKHATVTSAAPQLGGLEGCAAPPVPSCGIWDKVQDSTGSDRPSGHQQHMLTLLHHPRSPTWAKAAELSYTRQACAFPPGIGVCKRQGDKVMHSDKNHVFLSAEQLLCHSSEQRVALLPGRTQPSCSYAHGDRAVPAAGPGTEALQQH